MSEGAAMTRGGRTKTREVAERRCIATGASGPTAGLIRFVLAPDGTVVPDLAGKLPGRGAWLTADRHLVDKAVRRRLFSRSLRCAADAPADLADRIERHLVERLTARLALARKAGQAVTGFEKTRALIESGRAGVYLVGSDAATDGRDRLARIDPHLPVVSLLDSGELGLAFGRDFAIHAALERGGGFARDTIDEARRLAGFRITADRRAGGGAPGHGQAAAGRGNGQAGPQGGPGQDDG